MDTNEFADICIKKIELLENIRGKLDYEPDYEVGYTDACVAIKNTINTLKNEVKEGKIL